MIDDTNTTVVIEFIRSGRSSSSSMYVCSRKRNRNLTRTNEILNKWRARLVTDGQLHRSLASQPVAVRNVFGIRRRYRYTFRLLNTADEMKSSGPDPRPSFYRSIPLAAVAVVVTVCLSFHFSASTVVALSTAYRETYTEDAVVLEGKGWKL